jgi:lipopolysaccharide export LptBFGC system permease protein LptF
MSSITGTTESIDILPVSVAAKTFTPTGGQSVLFFMLFVAVVPIVIFILGIVIYLRRKKL